MHINVREGKFDVVIAAGPGVELWPSCGVKALSLFCSEMGLKVGLLGGEALTVKGVVPLPSTGGIILAEDIQKRIHRIRGRAIVRVVPEATLPNPFPGWRSNGLISIQTAERLRTESQVLWEPTTVILGTGNRALRFGSALLESGVSSVIAIESYAQWAAKRFSSWEVERRRFEIAGGKLIEAKPVQLSPKGPLNWQLRVQDSLGIRVLDVGRVVSAGPFYNWNGVREYPAGSSLFELDQTAKATPAEHFEGWATEEERGYWLAGKIIKSLLSDLGTNKTELDRIYRRAKGRLKRYAHHREAPFTPTYQGKWLSIPEQKKLRSFSGVPQKVQLKRPIASIECFEEIPCNLCQISCPENAIQIGKVPRTKFPILNESACTGCGACLVACPSSAIPLVHEKENYSYSRITLPWRGSKIWTKGELATLLNRRGESLGSARVMSVSVPGDGPSPATQLVELDVPTHLIWEARGIRRNRPPSSEDEAFLSSHQKPFGNSELVEITLNGEKRLVRDKISISTALFETGQNRPGDMLICKDGSCGLCEISVDSTNKLACQTRIHKGMSLKTESTPSEVAGPTLCPCLGVTEQDVLNRLQHASLQSPEAVLAVTHVGEGKCHGRLCMNAFKRILLDQGLDVSRWIDWRFPWSEWVLSHS